MIMHYLQWNRWSSEIKEGAILGRFLLPQQESQPPWQRGTLTSHLLLCCMLPRMVTVGEKMKQLWLRVLRDHKLVSTSSTNDFLLFNSHLGFKPETCHESLTHNRRPPRWQCRKLLSVRCWPKYRLDRVPAVQWTMTVFLSSYIRLELQWMWSEWFPLGYSLNT